jgi:VWFA-related protein
VATVGAQPVQQPPTFRSGTDVIQIDVSVLDRDRRPIPGLTAADFVVREDGNARPVVAVSQVEAEPPAIGAAGWTSDIPSDISSNQVPYTRVFVIVLDDALVPHDPHVAQLARAAALAVVDHLAPTDRAAVVFTSNAERSQPLTTDKLRLRTAIHAFTPRGTPSGPRDWNGYVSSARTLGHIADYLVGVPGPRKSIIYISPGIPVNLKALAPGIEEALAIDAIRDVFPKARRANVTIHAIDPGGNAGSLPTPGASVRGLAEHATARQLDQFQQDVLGAFAASTGGRLVVRTDNVAPAVVDIFAEYRRYYIVGFQSGATKRDGKFRTIDVRVNGRNATVLARGGYFATESGAPARPASSSTLDAAVNGWMELTGTPLQVTTASFAAPDQREAIVAVALGVRHVRSGEASRLPLKSDMLLRAFTPDGREVTTERVRADIALRPGALRTVYYELLATLRLAPGRYLLRLATATDQQARVGSVFHEITVPDFERAPLSMSGIIVSTVPALHSAPRGTFSGVLPVNPTANRDFPRDIRVSAFGRVYQKIGTPPVPATLTARVLDTSDTAVARFDQQLAAERFVERQGVDYSIDIPVASLKPGEYLLSIEAKAGATTEARHVRFRID